jgi:hypothetical protein
MFVISADFWESLSLRLNSGKSSLLSDAPAMCIVLSPELWNTSTFFVTTTYTCAGDSQSRACPLWTIPHFRTIHGVLEVMTEFFLACSRPPYPQECAHQTQRDEFLLADKNVAHTHADDHGATKVSRRKHSTAQGLSR